MVVCLHGGAWTRWTKEHNSFQAPAFAAVLHRRGHTVTEIDLPGGNRFDVGEAFADPDGPLLRAAFQAFGL